MPTLKGMAMAIVSLRYAMCAHKYNNKYKEDDELVYVMLYVATGEDLQCPAVPGVCLKI